MPNLLQNMFITQRAYKRKFWKQLFWRNFFLPSVLKLDWWLREKCFIRLSETVKLAVALVVLFTYGLLMTAPMEAVWDKIRPYVKENISLYYYGLRTLMIFGNGKTKNNTYNIIISTKIRVWRKFPNLNFILCHDLLFIATWTDNIHADWLSLIVPNFSILKFFKCDIEKIIFKFL